MNSDQMEQVRRSVTNVFAEFMPKLELGSMVRFEKTPCPVKLVRYSTNAGIAKDGSVTIYGVFESNPHDQLHETSTGQSLLKTAEPRMITQEDSGRCTSGKYGLGDLSSNLWLTSEQAETLRCDSDFVDNDKIIFSGSMEI